MATPGLMFVASRPKTITDELYNRFYNEEHLPDVISHGITKIGLRYQNSNPDAKEKYIALYPVQDAAVMASPEVTGFIEDTKKSKILECDDIYDLIEFNLKPYAKIQKYEGNGGGSSKMIISVAVEPADDEDLDRWYREEHYDGLSKDKGYVRSTRYKRLDAIEPRFLALHEYDCEVETVPTENLAEIMATEWSKRIKGEAKIFKVDRWRLIQKLGDEGATL